MWDATTKIKGNIGENIACEYLRKQGFVIVDRNYYRKWGELDIVAKTDNMIHFFEVKSVTNRSHAPEENVHGLKVSKLRKIIGTYLSDKGYGLDATFQFHILCVYMNEKTRLASVKWIKNVIL